MEFAAMAGVNESKISPEKLLVWLQLPAVFPVRDYLINVIYAWQGFMTALTLTVITGWIDYRWLILASLLNLSLVGLYLKKISKIARLLGKTDILLRNYDDLFGKLKELRCNSPWIRKRLSTLISEPDGATREIKKMRRLMNRFENRNNILIGFTRNALFLTDLLLMIQMEKWRRKNTANLGIWLDTLGDIDALSSLATFAYNNPSYTFPEPVPDDYVLDAREAGHPLIPIDDRVNNDFRINGWKNIIILTGANMAGKSTFLRSIGLNLVLAHTGAPVAAATFRFKPARLMTSIRTDDSLLRHESYFYVELKKLKYIIDALEEKQEVFILLDEVLKGTNSLDKMNGSMTLVRKLLNYTTSGILATHDIALGELEKELPSNIRNYCFEADITGDHLYFDYKLRQGSAKNMTALFLMKKMNIVS
jgi:hypothetical protein